MWTIKKKKRNRQCREKVVKVVTNAFTCMAHLALSFADSMDSTLYVLVNQIGVSCVYMKNAGYVIKKVELPQTCQYPLVCLLPIVMSSIIRLPTGLCFGFW